MATCELVVQKKGEIVASCSSSGLKMLIKCKKNTFQNTLILKVSVRKWNVENSWKCSKKFDNKEISVSRCSPGGASKVHAHKRGIVRRNVAVFGPDAPRRRIKKGCCALRRAESGRLRRRRTEMVETR